MAAVSCTRARPQLRPCSHSCLCRSSSMVPGRRLNIGEARVALPLVRIRKPATWADVLRRGEERMPGKRETATEPPTRVEGLPVVQRNVAGIDLGSEQHWVCAPTLDGRDREIASFGATTAELIRMAN